MRGYPLLFFHDIVLVVIEILDQFDVKILEAVCLLEVLDLCLTLLDQWSEGCISQMVSGEDQYPLRFISFLLDVPQHSFYHEVCFSHG